MPTRFDNCKNGRSSENGNVNEKKKKQEGFKNFSVMRIDKKIKNTHYDYELKFINSESQTQTKPIY